MSIEKTSAPGWLPLVLETFRSGSDRWQQGELRIWRVTGGANNALFKVKHGEDIFACKLLVPDDRQRAKREVGAMRLFQAAGLDLAPRLVAWDLSEAGQQEAAAPYPWVVYDWIDGEPIPAQPDAAHLTALMDSFQRMQSLRPDAYSQLNLLPAFFHWQEVRPYLEELHSFMSLYSPWLADRDEQGYEWVKRLERLVTTCERRLLAPPEQAPPGPNPRLAVGQLRFCRVDPNLNNALWRNANGVCWVDWEYSGWGDPALELAELRWHASWSQLTAGQHAWMRQVYIPPEQDESFWGRVAVWDILLATRWPLLVLRVLWSKFNGPDRVRLTQLGDSEAVLRERLIHFIDRAEAQVL